MKHLYRLLILTISLGLAAAIIPGCGDGGDDLVVAEVGSDKITAGVLNDIFEKNNARHLTYDDEFNHRRAVLDSLVIQQLLIQEAYRKNIDESEEVNRLVLGNKDKFLLDILYLREIEDKVSVSEDEIKQMYDRLEYKYHAAHILTRTEEEALELLDSIQNGGNFEELAVNFSVDPSAKRNRGDLGFFQYGQMVDEFQNQVMKINPGEMSRPFQTKFGWHIVKMIERVPNEQRQGFSVMHDDLEQMAMSAQRRTIQNEFKERLKANSPVTVETATLDYLQHKRETLYPEQVLKNLPKNDFDPAQLDRHEKELILATWQGGQMTLGEYLAEIKKVPASLKPNLDDAAALGDFVFELNIMDLLSAEARRQGLEDDDEYKAKIKRFKELTMADVMQNDSLPDIPVPTEEELRAYYDEHLDDFVVPAKAHVYEILLSSRDEAMDVRNRIKSLSRFQEVAAERTERAGRRNAKGDLGYIEQQYYPALFDLAMSTSVGGIAGPIEIGDKYATIYVADKKAEETTDYLTAKPRLEKILDREKRREAFESWVEQKKKETKIVIHENNIKPGINKAKYDEETGA